MKKFFQLSIDHSHWANLRCLEVITDFSEDAGPLIKLLAHIIITEEIYLQRMKGNDPFPQNFWSYINPVQMNSLLKKNKKNYILFIEEMSRSDFSKLVRYRNSKGTYYETPVIEMMGHVFLHSAHHRGQFNSILRSAGNIPPSIDLITFTRI